MTARKEISNYQFSKEIDVTQNTAWSMKHFIRKTCCEIVESMLDILKDNFTVHTITLAEKTYKGILMRVALDFLKLLHSHTRQN